LICKIKNIVNFLLRKLPFHSIRAKHIQRRLVQVSGFEVALLQKHTLHRAQKTNLAGVSLDTKYSLSLRK
jgi:hypothetical protein